MRRTRNHAHALPCLVLLALILVAGGCGRGEQAAAPDAAAGLTMWVDDGPDKPATSIRVTLDEAAWLTLTVRDAGGGLVRVLIDGQRPQGTLTAVWDGRDDDGDLLASGPYWAVAATDDGRQAIAMMMIK